ncbi:prolyl oligopeptidase [Entophlyctis helioformis]|nr:prolyl oligopeptidase [Entophlyctis helioformis]
MAHHHLRAAFIRRWWASSASKQLHRAMSSFAYPAVRRSDHVDILHGRSVPDPYRWLEDPDSAETKAFVESQNKVTQAFIAKSAARESIKTKYTALNNYEKNGTPMRAGDAYYFFHNSGLQAQSVLYKMDSLDAPRKVFLDPNTMSSQGTVSISNYSFSESGKYFAYALSKGGSDWVDVHVRETADNAALSLESKPLEWVKFSSMSWTIDDLGFFYNRFAKPAATDADKKGTETDANKNPMIYYHKIGTPQETDPLVWSDKENPDHMFSTTVTEDGKYLVLSVGAGTNSERMIHVAPLTGELVAEYRYIANDGTLFWFVTTLDAPNRKVVKYDLAAPEKGFVDVIPESKSVLALTNVVNDNKLVIVYIEDVKHVMYMYDLRTGLPAEPAKLPLPEGSVVATLSGDRKHTELFYSYTSYLTPGTINRFDFTTNTQTVYRKNEVAGLNSDDFETRQVFFTSKDGTRVPMYLISHKNTPVNGNSPVLLYGYGGFNIPVMPSFSPMFLSFVQNFKDGIVAVANIRGGGEYGEKWYHGGRRNVKQNVFDDFQYAARHLIDAGHTSKGKIAIYGGSNGGLLVGACINQAPELFGAGIAAVGVLDMYRFHKFTIGAAWTSDYGNPDKAEDFEVLTKYSPLHNVDGSKTYPAVLITTGDHDDRVVPLHSHKFLATLQYHLKDNPKPLLGRIETDAGHGAGKSTQQRIEEGTDILAFVGLALGAETRA